jgi:hypothetical protein
MRGSITVTSPRSASRPEADCLPARREEIDADTLLAWLTGLQDKTLLALAKAEHAQDWSAIRGLIREGLENIALLGRQPMSAQDRADRTR